MRRLILLLLTGNLRHNHYQFLDFDLIYNSLLCFIKLFLVRYFCLLLELKAQLSLHLTD